MIYSVCTIEVPPGRVNDAVAGIGAAAEAGRFSGELRACWYSEIGRLNRILTIIGYQSAMRWSRRTRKC